MSLWVRLQGPEIIVVLINNCLVTFSYSLLRWLTTCFQEDFRLDVVSDPSGCALGLFI